MYILEKKQRINEMKELLKNLSEKKFIFKNGKFIKEEAQKKDLTTLSDEELISIIKNYDTAIINSNSSSNIFKIKMGKFNSQTNMTLTETDIKRVKEILFDRVINVIKIAKSIVNQEIINMPYDEMLQIISSLQFYIMNIVYDKKLVNLVNKLSSILVKKEDKKYEKTRLSI